MKTDGPETVRIDWHLTSGVWFILDALVGFLVVHVAFLMSAVMGRTFPDAPFQHARPYEAAIYFAVLLPVLAHVFELHNPLLPRQFWSILGRCVGVALVATGLLAVTVFGVLYQQIGRLILLQMVLYVPLYMFTARFLIWQQSEQRKRRILLLGSSPAVRNTRALIEQSLLPFEVFVIDEKPAVSAQRQPLQEYCREMLIDEAVTCDIRGMDSRTMEDLVGCLSLGVLVSEQACFVERNFLMVPVEDIRQEWFLQADLQWLHSLYEPVKRWLDILVALAGMLIFSPLMLLAVVAVKLEGWGPVFYSQMRVGTFNRPFRIWKLRTMQVDAETDGAQWAIAGDERVTRMGRILRKSRLDEIPQFWNILRGEMSLVGPRPERPEFVEKLSRSIPFYSQRHLVKPGLTGWAQINYRYGDSAEDALTKLRYDLYYIKYASLGLDLQIVLRTIGVFMRGGR
jgi:exopolysaccharide biosynthesis polyprenyl glycosylphosphotransferase